VDMGKPILEADKIPTTLPGNPPVNVPLFVPPISFHVTCVSMGNPHCVIFESDPKQNLLAADGYDLVREAGPLIETNSHFPRRINVHFVQVHSPNEVTMRTWERGSGVTLACGTGACAVAVAGVLTGRSARKVVAHLPGGDLDLHWSEADNHVYMTGPAVEVFSGEWPS
jgi:diaminopimelate epimerase